MSPSHEGPYWKHSRERVTRPSMSHQEAAGLAALWAAKCHGHHEINTIISAKTRCHHAVDFKLYHSSFMTRTDTTNVAECPRQAWLWLKERCRCAAVCPGHIWTLSNVSEDLLRFWRITNRVEQYTAFPTHSFYCGNPPQYEYLSATYWFSSFGAERPVLTHSWQRVFREKHDVIRAFHKLELYSLSYCICWPNQQMCLLWSGGFLCT